MKIWKHFKSFDVLDSKFKTNSNKFQILNKISISFEYCRHIILFQ